MSYRVTLMDMELGEETVIHSPINRKLKLSSGVVTQSADSIDSFDFSFDNLNPATAFIKELKTEIEVLDVNTGVIEFEGRIKNRVGTTDTGGNVSRKYSADDAIIYLDEITNYEFEYSGAPKGLLEKLIEHYNAHTDPHKQFSVGLCEVDAYKVYVTDDDPTVNAPLGKGDKATIKPTTKYIWNNDGVRLNIATSVLGVTHTVETIGANGVFADKYLLRHPNSAWGISGWVQKNDIVESYTINTAVSVTNASSKSIYIEGSKVRIKKGTKTYFGSSDGTGAKSISSEYFDRTYTVKGYSNEHDRYSLYYMGKPSAWVNASDLEGGSNPAPSQSLKNNARYVYKKRTIEAKVDYSDTTLDAIKEHLLVPFNAEIYWERIEGVRTINIVDRRLNETNQKIAIGLNLVSMQENYDPSSVITRLVPLGKLKKEEVPSE